FPPGLYRHRMKPPHGNRPGGSGRPPSDRGPRPGGGKPGGGKPGGSGRPFNDRGPKSAAVSPNRLSLSGGQQDQRGRDQRRAPAEGLRSQGGYQGGQGGYQGGQSFQQRSDGPRRDGNRYDQRPRQQDGPRPGPDTPRGAVWLYGHHAVAAALA